jgi:tryptophan synthase alpha chain
MKNRITKLFQRKKKDVLSVFFTAGYPSLNDTVKIASLLEASGVDVIEIGIPFSDPLADGPVIQRSSAIALKNGMSLSLLFMQLQELRKQVSIPVILMGYLNPVMQYGMENFIKSCKAVGVDGVILPDLPPDIYIGKYKSLFVENNISNIFLITPKTQLSRIETIDLNSDGFIYLLSASSTTGAKASFNEESFTAIKSMSLKNPLLIGFGISDKEAFLKANDFASGGIIGSAFIKAIEVGQPEYTVPSFISSILN